MDISHALFICLQRRDSCCVRSAGEGPGAAAPTPTDNSRSRFWVIRAVSVTACALVSYTKVKTFLLPTSLQLAETVVDRNRFICDDTDNIHSNQTKFWFTTLPLNRIGLDGCLRTGARHGVTWLVLFGRETRPVVYQYLFIFHAAFNLLTF